MASSHRPSALSGHARSASSSSAPSGAIHRSSASTSRTKPSDRLVELKQSSGSMKRSSSAPGGRSSNRSEMELARRKVKLLSSFPRAISPTLPPSPPASRSPSPTRHASSLTSASASVSTSPVEKNLGSSGGGGKSIPSPPSEVDDGDAVRPSSDRKRKAVERDDEEKDARRRRQERKREVEKIDWSTEKFKAIAHSFRERARKLKHSADARSRSSSTPSSSGQQPPSVLFLTELTDSILLWVYAFWADDQTTPGRVNVDMWRSLDGMKKVVRSGWENVVKLAEADTSKAGRRTSRRVRMVLGLVYLVDALVLVHTTTYAQSSLHNRTLKLQASVGRPAAAASNGGGLKSTNGSITGEGGGGGSIPADSPASLASSSVSSPSSASDPPTLAGLPPDYLSTVLNLTASLTRAVRLFGTAQALLSERELERSFPKTWKRCHRSPRSDAFDSDDDDDDEDGEEDELDDVLLFSPKSPYLVDPDEPSLGWAWPLGLASVPALAGIPGVPSDVGVGGNQPPGMGGMLAHLVGFGRSLLGEWVEGRGELKGWKWDLKEGWKEGQ